MEKEIRDRFKKMCEGYFDNVSKKLVIEHNVSQASHAKFRALKGGVAPSRAGQKKS